LSGAQVPQTAQLALQAVEDGYAVVIGLQSTGEVRLSFSLEPERHLVRAMASVSSSADTCMCLL